VAPAFAKSADFAINKPAGQPCPNLRGYQCGIHDRLRDKGFPGCVVFDCFGAGQKVAQVTFGGQEPANKKPLHEVFAMMRQLHELLWYLNESAALVPEAAALRDEIEQLTLGTADHLRTLDVTPYRQRTNEITTRASTLARRGHNGTDFRGKDLAGASLRGTNLRGASLRGAILIGADLREADLREADVIGADLRGADLSAADLRTTIFLIQSQLDSARGSKRTKLPAGYTTPPHWNE
jgi:hypothetical protein